MARASIGVSPMVKQALDAAKPEGMAWNDFFEILLQAADTGRFLRGAETKLIASEKEAVARARARYTQHRADPTQAISGTELRRRIHLRRLLDSLDFFRGSLRLAADNPDGANETAIGVALVDLDEQIHSTRALLAV